MTNHETAAERISMANTKKEMLEAYNRLRKQLEERREAEMKPEQKIEEKKNREAVEVADSLSTEGIGKEIGTLRSEIGTMLVQLSDKLEEEIAKYLQVKQAVVVKEKELREIYEIEKTATSLAALLEVQEEKRATFEAEMARYREDLETEIETKREEWLNEEAAHEAEMKERDDAEKKRRGREAEEYKYKFERERQLAAEEFEYQKAKFEREALAKKEEIEKDLTDREKALAESEGELRRLRGQAEALPKELEAAVAKAVQQSTERLRQDNLSKEELLKKEFEGEQNVLKSRIEALQQTVKEQSAQIAKLSAQLDKSYGQVQDIAVKAIEGSSNVKAFVHAQPLVSEPTRRSSQTEDK